MPEAPNFTDAENEALLDRLFGKMPKIVYSKRQNNSENIYYYVSDSIDEIAGPEDIEDRWDDDDYVGYA